MADLNAVNSPAVGDIFKYEIEMKIFINDGKTIETINQINIHDLLINYEYDSMNMPISFLTVALDKRLINDMITHIDKSLISLKVSKYVSNSDMPGIKIDTITGQFVYFIGEEYVIDTFDYIGQNADRKDIYKVITIGLMKLDHINNNKKTFNGVINNTNTTSLVYYCCGSLPLVLEPIQYNKSVNRIMFPMVQSVSKAISYVNTHTHTYYDSMYRFFMDFDYTYLVSSSGKVTVKKGDKINSIIINILNKDKQEFGQHGMKTDTKQKVFIITVPYDNCQPIENTATGGSFTTLSVANSGGVSGSQAISKHKNSKITAKDRLIRVPDGNENLLKNKMSVIENSATGFFIMITDIDRDIFTINNKINIKATDLYPDKDGEYLMATKKELYTREQNHMTLAVTLVLNKIAK